MPPHRGAGQAPQVWHDENQSGFFVIPAEVLRQAQDRQPAERPESRMSAILCLQKSVNLGTTTLLPQKYQKNFTEIIPF